MRKDPKVFLEHIKESIGEIENYIKNISVDKFADDTKTQDAVIRRIEIIGEAAKNLPSDFKRKNPDIEWREIVSMRNKLIHEYFGIDIDLIWKVVKNDIPKLKKQILDLLKKLKKA
ncbi:DUF86 domain-containing protein [Patescibacteria group bacterium]|nr:DUF86 domain-containing protein [Patescibacteria group bacterium]MBU4367787.1 DUF86 domain-containing protein [Patescibacteria group bacterium]MBU4461477.1 DUF86 domain-containing protein [Patescibacteria group bacterium]MCG2700391.1 DUF86 domain-containing protein [Candidatus Parcubacteria bacterium]